MGDITATGSLMFCISAQTWWPDFLPRKISQSKNSALWIISVAFVKPFVVTYGCMHDMPSPAPCYYLLLHHSAKSSSMRKCRAEFMPGDTSSPWNTQGNQSHAEPEKRVLSQHTAHWKLSRQQVIYEGKSYTDVKTVMKNPFHSRQQALWLPNAQGAIPCIYYFKIINLQLLICNNFQKFSHFIKWGSS